jgi:hypothetical protein
MHNKSRLTLYNVQNLNYQTESRVPQILAGSLVPFAIASVTVLARLVTRGLITHNWGTDDSWILISWVRSPPPIHLFAERRYKQFSTDLRGRSHDPELRSHKIWRWPSPISTTIHQYKTALLLGYFVRIVYQLVLGTTKIAICTLFLRIFDSNEKDRYAMYSLLAFIGCYTTLFLFTSTFQCHPVSDAWENENSPTCSNYVTTLWATGICNILVDLLLLVFVVPRISKLSM